MKSIYSQVRNKISPGDVLEFAGTSLLSKAIRAVTKKPVNHTGIAIWMQPEWGPDFSAYCYSPHRLYIGEAIENGFRLTFASRHFRGYDGKIYWLRLKDEYRDQGVRLVEAALELEGVAYDYFSLVRNLWRHVPLDRDRVYCSETVHLALIKAGLIDPGFNNGCGLRPGEFGSTGLFEEPVRIQ